MKKVLIVIAFLVLVWAIIGYAQSQTSLNRDAYYDNYDYDNYDPGAKVDYYDFPGAGR